MIQEEELMIGDWVCGLNGDKAYPGKVKELGGYADIIIETTERPDDFEPGDNFEIIIPIPITPEILRKNEFMPISKDKYVYAQVTVDLDESLVIIKSKDARMTINIVYVHQLQHALRLCNIEKDIKL